MKNRRWLSESFVIDIVAGLAPWLTPIPTAYLVATATIKHLNWPPVIGIITGIIIESLGLAAMTTVLMLREYNGNKRQSDPTAPFFLSIILVGIYLSVAIALTVLLDIYPPWAIYSPAIFPLLSLCGMTILAIRSDHRRVVQVIEEDKQGRRQRDKERRETKRSQIPLATKSSPKLDKAQRQEAILDFYRSNGDGDFNEFANEKLGVTYEAARKDRKELVSNGPLVFISRGKYFVLEEEENDNISM